MLGNHDNVQDRYVASVVSSWISWLSLVDLLSPESEVHSNQAMGIKYQMAVRAAVSMAIGMQ